MRLPPSPRVAWPRRPRHTRGSLGAALAFLARVALLLGVFDVGRGLVPAQRLFVVHRVVGLLGLVRRRALALVRGVRGVRLPVRVLAVLHRLLHLVGLFRRRGLVVVEPAHAGFLLRAGALVVGGGVGRLLGGGGAHLLFCHAGKLLVTTSPAHGKPRRDVRVTRILNPHPS